jgi:hypothetical protein
MPRPDYLKSRSATLGSVLAIAFLATGVSQAFAAPASTTVTLAVTAAGKAVTTVPAAEEVTLTATVEAAGLPVTAGSVNFCDAAAASCTDIHLLGSAMLGSAGTAQITVTLPAGAQNYKAEFEGTAANAASSSSGTAIAVTASTATTITQSGSQGSYSLTATVTGSGLTEAPTGSVSFEDTSAANAVLGTANLVAGKAGTPAFVSGPSPAVKPLPQTVAVGDFNGDGIPDLAITTNALPGVTGSTGYVNILLGNGDGTFQTAQSVAALPNNAAMVAAPFINGGPLDVLMVNNNTTGTNNAALFTGDGKGSGAIGTPFSLGGVTNVTAVAAGDFNRDGNEDFVFTGVIFGSYVFAPVLGNGNGTFGVPTLNAIGSNPLLVAVGAFGPSGYPDIAVVDTGADQATIFENNSQGYFIPGGQANTGTSPTAMVTGDFNGDGFLDLAVVNAGSDTVTILLGKGNYTLTPAAASPATGHSPAAIAVGDFNGDGVPDLAVVNAADNTVSILIGKGDGTFTSGGTLSTGTAPIAIAAGNFMGAGFNGLAVANSDPASTTGGTLTVLNSTLAQTATATVTGIAPTGAGAHLVDAAYAGDIHYGASVSATASLTGTAPAGAGATLSVASLTFTGQTVGSTSTAQTVTLTNSGQAALAITSIVATAGFQQTNTCGASVAGGSSCTISVAFAPTAAGSAVGTLTITDNATGATTQTIALSGTGQSVGVTSGSTSLSLASSGGSTTATISLSSQSGFSGTVGLTCAVTYKGTGTAANPPTCALSPAQVQVSTTTAGSSTLTVATGTTTAALRHPGLRDSGLAFAALLCFVFFPRRKKALFAVLFCVVVLGSAIGCGSSSSKSSSTSTTPGSYSVVVTATSSTLSANTTIALTVQ